LPISGFNVSQDHVKLLMLIYLLLQTKQYYQSPKKTA